MSSTQPQTVSEIEPDMLHLDRDNPRFGMSAADSDDLALKALVSSANLRELWGSIAARGFERFEPLIGVPHPEIDGHVIIIEGNRRLAAVKTLLEPSLVGSSTKSVPTLSPEARSSINTLPVIVVPDREFAQDYIGFKHVNGPATWSSLAKARYGVRLLLSDGGPGTLRDRMEVLTRRLGDSRGMLLRVFIAYKIYEQAIDQEIVSPTSLDDQKVDFSHLYTMLNHPPTRTFLGLPSGPLSEESVRDNPIPTEKLDSLKQLFGWLFGPKSVIRRQGSDRPRLQKVIASSEGLRALITTDDLKFASAKAGLGQDDWMTTLYSCAASGHSVYEQLNEIRDDLTDEQVSEALDVLKKLLRSLAIVNTSLSSGE